MLRSLERCLVLLLLMFSVAPAGAALHESEKLQISADFRARLETDQDSQTGTGVPRDDRTRLRARARVQLAFRPGEAWTLGLRLRSGSDLSHQSPHVTLVDFDDNDTGDADFNLDRWSLGWKYRESWAWLGRDRLPFWKPDEMYWDDDVTLPGIAGGWGRQWTDHRLELAGGYFALPVGLKETTGNMGGLQIAFSGSGNGSGPDWKVALGLLDFDANPADPDAPTLLSGNGLRDYQVLSLSGQVTVKTAARDLRFTTTLLTNLDDYSPLDPDPVTAANADETDGFTLGAFYGKLASPGDWLAGYTFARIETLAVNASFAQDDWMRWGSANETRSSDFRGHELRFGYKLHSKVNLILRLYSVESITSVEDGKRARLDLNVKF